MTYEEFVSRKQRKFTESGFTPISLDQYGLFDFQSHTVRWALGKGRACIFAGTGLGKTRIQVAIADQVARHTGKPFLIMCPLAVAGQTIEEAAAQRGRLPSRVPRDHEGGRHGVATGTAGHHEGSGLSRHRLVRIGGRTCPFGREPDHRGPSGSKGALLMTLSFFTLEPGVFDDGGFARRTM